jgi:Holliday junction DNA helicase RuvB
MEDFKYEGKNIPEFTLFGATTEMGQMMERAKPFYDRFKIIIELEKYKVSELVQMAKGYTKRKYPTDLFEDKTLTILAENCRLTPRGLIRLIDMLVCFNGDLKETLKSFNIIHKGFTSKDLQILQYLSHNPKGTGIQSLTAFLNTSQKNYMYENEPYLIQNEAIIRTPRGRMLSPKGLKLMKELEKKI